MLLLAFFLPLYASICIWALPFFIKKRACLLYISCLYVISFCINFFFLNIAINSSDIWFFDLGVWLKLDMLNIRWLFLFDTLSLFMLVMIGYISGLVHLFSINYMALDYNIIRFFSLLSLFTFFMYLLVCSSNFIILFLGWEGIGICSYLLISFWNTKIQAPKAGIKAIILNRVGDFGFLGGVGLIFYYFRTLDFDIVFSLLYYFNELFLTTYFELTIIDCICLLLLLGTVGKSAQMGLHFWLPDAMEGPTPVSALIHAATLVTAGVFLVIRCSFLFEYSNISLFWMLLLGGFTALMGASISFTQSDIKKVIAFSTTSQLGYMVFCCGLSKYAVSIFHLFNHAFFKSLLFLSAGALIHEMYHEQDLRRYGFLLYYLPFTAMSMAVGFLTLLSFPFLSGFYSKDMILETSISLYILNSSFVYWFGFITAFLTAFYSIRVFYLIYLGYGALSFKYVFQSIKELPYFIGFCLFFLGIAAVTVGYLFKDLIIGSGSPFWNNASYAAVTHFYGFDYEVIPLLLKNLPVTITGLSLCLAFILNKFFYSKSISILNIKSVFIVNTYDYIFNKYFHPLYTVYIYLNFKWFFDLIFNYFLGFLILRNSYNILYKLIDKGVIEIIFVNYFSKCINTISNFYIRQQMGYFFNTLSLLMFSSFFIYILIFFIS